MELVKVFEVSIAVTGIINCLIVAVLLLYTDKGIKKANHILSMLLIAISLKMSYALIINLQQSWSIPIKIIASLSEAAFLSFGPLLYLYYKSYFGKEVNNIWSYIIFIPSLMPFIQIFNSHNFFNTTVLELQIYFTIWLVLVFIQLRNYYAEKPENKHFKLEKLWITTLYASFLCIWVVVNFLMIDFKYYFFELAIVLTVVIYINAYVYVKHYWFKKGDVLNIEPGLKKVKKFILNQEKENEIYTMLLEVMGKEKLYIDPEITLPKVASRINTRPHNLSFVINKRMKMTFNEFINSYRINDIKNVMKQKEFQDMKIASLAFDYGFNTISSFNTAFKRFTNYTPSEYRMEAVAGQN